MFRKNTEVFYVITVKYNKLEFSHRYLLYLTPVSFLYITGKSPSIWDNFTHTHPELFPNEDNGDVACNSYELYREDVKILKDIGVGIKLLWLYCYNLN